MLTDAGFDRIEQHAGLQVWRAGEFPDVLLEVLNVDAYPTEPISKIAGFTAKQIDQERRQTCVSLGMDPYYRCMLYAPDRSLPAGVLFDQLSNARKRLYSCFIDIAALPGAQVPGEWAVWRRKPLPK
ncbi:MAG: hypothetical protein QNJ97_11085 [Myxococcota bacterium]|nr:hypothetical protein [Myxococcota bacterium]